MCMLNGEVALLSGVNIGLGHDTALRFAQEMADLVSSWWMEIIAAIAAEVCNLGARCLMLLADICRPEDCATAARAALDGLGQSDILKSIAYKGAWPNITSLLESAPELADWRECFQVNVFGTLQMTRVVTCHIAEGESL
jgi:NAD(P)-dependent dehydrogenase (short-subunit alcohol dehydrogenase family)